LLGQWPAADSGGGRRGTSWVYGQGGSARRGEGRVPKTGGVNIVGAKHKVSRDMREGGGGGNNKVGARIPPGQTRGGALPSRIHFEGLYPSHGGVPARGIAGKESRLAMRRTIPGSRWIVRWASHCLQGGIRGVGGGRDGGCAVARGTGSECGGGGGGGGPEATEREQEGLYRGGAFIQQWVARVPIGRWPPNTHREPAHKAPPHAVRPLAIVP